MPSVFLARAGVKPLDMPGFNLNTNTDTLLKRDFEQYRGVAHHPIMAAFGLGHLRPFRHEQLDKWTSSTQFGSSSEHFNTVHEPTNILFGGGVDDVWENAQTGELYIVDYKSTAQLSQSGYFVAEATPFLTLRTLSTSMVSTSARRECLIDLTQSERQCSLMRQSYLTRDQISGSRGSSLRPRES